MGPPHPTSLDCSASGCGQTMEDISGLDCLVKLLQPQPQPPPPPPLPHPPPPSVVVCWEGDCWAAEKTETSPTYRGDNFTLKWQKHNIKYSVIFPLFGELEVG